MREKGLGRVYAVLFILLWLIFLGSLLTGLIPVNVQHLLMGTLTDEEKTVLTVIRLPRFFYGALIGSALAASGAALQGVFGNPLAAFFVRPLCQDSLALHQRPSCSSTSSGP